MGYQRYTDEQRADVVAFYATRVDATWGHASLRVGAGGATAMAWGYNDKIVRYAARLAEMPVREFRMRLAEKRAESKLAARRRFNGR